MSDENIPDEANGSDSEPVLFAMDGRVAEFTLNRPDKRNALNAEVIEKLRAGINRAEREGARVGLLLANGSAFSAGADLAALQALRTATHEQNLADSRLLARLFHDMRGAPFPIVAAVQGHAIAGGAGLVAAADYAVAASDALLGFTEVRIGFVPAIIMYFVAQRLGDADLRDLLLSGRLVNGDRAAEIGLVSEAVPAADVRSTARRWAEMVADRTSAAAVSRTKRLIGEIRQMTLDDALEYAARVNAEARQTDDCRAGVDAFLRGEKPPWYSEGGR